MLSGFKEGQQQVGIELVFVYVRPGGGPTQILMVVFLTGQNKFAGTGCYANVRTDLPLGGSYRGNKCGCVVAIAHHLVISSSL